MERRQARSGRVTFAGTNEPSAERSGLSEAELPASLTPELVLVSPDLALLARDRLPDRPWELLCSPAPRETAEPVQAADPTSRHSEVSGRGGVLGRPLVVVHGAALAVLVVFVVVASALPPRDAPTLGRGSTRDPAKPPTEATPVIRATDRRPVTRAPTPRVSGLDLYSSPQLYLQVNRGGRTIARFEGVVRCAGRVTLANISVGSRGTFGVRRQFWRKRGALIVALEGRVSNGTVRGTVRALGRGCRTRSVHFTATPRPG